MKKMMKITRTFLTIMLGLVLAIELGLVLVACTDKKEVPLTPLEPGTPVEPITPEEPVEDEIEDRVINYISGDKFDKEYFTIDVTGYNTLELTDLTLLQSTNSYINVTDVKVDDKLEDLTVLGATTGTKYLDDNTAGNLHMTNYKVIIDTYNPLGALRLRVSDNSGTLRIDVSTFSKIEFNLASNASTNKVTANIKLKK